MTLCKSIAAFTIVLVGGSYSQGSDLSSSTSSGGTSMTSTSSGTESPQHLSDSFSGASSLNSKDSLGGAGENVDISPRDGVFQMEADSSLSADSKGLGMGRQKDRIVVTPNYTVLIPPIELNKRPVREGILCPNTASSILIPDDSSTSSQPSPTRVVNVVRTDVVELVKKGKKDKKDGDEQVVVCDIGGTSYAAALPKMYKSPKNAHSSSFGSPPRTSPLKSSGSPRSPKGGALDVINKESLKYSG